MDSRLIYEASKYLKPKIEWIKQSYTEWIYCGLGQEIKKDLVINHINAFFKDTKLYVANKRQESFESRKDLVFSLIENLLTANDFLVWDSTFNCVMEFNHIGVFRCGKKIMEK